jgi:predicted kinase
MNAPRQLFRKEVGGGSDIVFIELKSDVNTIRQRLQQKRKYSEADFEVYKLLEREWEPMDDPHLLLESTNDNIEDMLKKTAGYLQRKHEQGTN